MTVKIEKDLQDQENPNQKSRLLSAWADHGRQFDSYRWVYPVVSRRSQGISLGINLNLDTHCNFDCVYCQVDRSTPIQGPTDNDVQALEAELRDAVAHWQTNRYQDAPRFQGLDQSQLELRDICMSGDGEPTMAPEFAQVCTMLYNLQCEMQLADLKLVVITNATLLNQSKVQKGLEWLTKQKGEIWGKLDAGTQEWYQRIDRSRYCLDQIESNLCQVAALYPLRIQTMLCKFHGEIPSADELASYAQRIMHIEHAARLAGRSLLEIQLYSVVRRTAEQEVQALPQSFLEDARQALIHMGVTTPISLY